MTDDAPGLQGRFGQMNRTPRNIKVTGLGQCSLDTIALVDGYPREDTKPEAIDIIVEGGGPVATALVALSRLGARTTFIGRISDDAAGREIKRGLRREGVSTRGLRTKKGGASQRAFIIVNTRTASRTVIWKRPTVPELEPDEVDPALIRGASLLLLDGLMVDASLRAAKIAREYNIPVMLDAGRLREGTLEIVKRSDYIVGSERLAKDLASTPARAIERLCSIRPGAAAVTITLGRRGSITRTGGRTIRTPAFRVEAVDTTGAGDVFHGGYAYGIAKGWKMEETLRFASALSALKCLSPGGRSGIPGLGEVLDFMKRHAG